MKLMVALISTDDVKEVSDKLNRNLISSSKITSERNLFGPGMTTVLIACNDDQVDQAIEILKETAGCRRRQFVNQGYESGLVYSNCEEGGGAVFVVNVDEYVKL